ncbi:META domain-containing protein [Methanolobus mangrovi]|uniref:META domain-containing protein n=1 Tax=Methanolobus mangrovi TaxID=3072977 RepID=A0AA51UGS6_9EURY|nr:META domain-containing protein [Methanolobus mangrovi]WMW22933.1 META domain-containing protein [Methanolobus mangrovi]
MLIKTEPASRSVVPDSKSYTIVFNSDETSPIKADCNVGNGSYTLERSNLILSSGPMTLAYCATDSLDTQYLSLLSNVTTVSIDNGKLVLGIGENGYKMLFVKRNT